MPTIPDNLDAKKVVELKISSSWKGYRSRAKTLR
jgi:hypothetical protein